MEVEQNDRGFRILTQPVYRGVDPLCPAKRLVQESSAIGPYDDAIYKPGSSFLWVGPDHHLSREEVSGLVQHLTEWLQTGRLPLAPNEEGE